MIEGKRILLRGWREADLPALAQLRNDVALQAQLLSRARGSDIEQVRRWAQERASSPHSLLFVVCERGSDDVLGYLQLTGLDDVGRRAELGICLRPQSQGQGLGREVLQEVQPYLRDVWALRKLSLRVRRDNDRAIRCYERVGFERCGMLHEHVFIEGRFQDVVLMELFLRARS